MDALTVLVVGSIDQAEFAAAAQSLATARTVVCATPAEAYDWLTECNPADLMVLAQRWSGEFSTAEVDRLRRAAPLVPVWGLLGSWCEGETRSGRPWPGASRAYWHHWGPRFERDSAAFAVGGCPAWGLPMTSTDEERLLATEPGPAIESDQLVVVCSSSKPAADWIVAACQHGGYRAAWFRASPRPSALDNELSDAAAVIWDGRNAGDDELGEVRALRKSFPGAPILALADFPRWQDVERLTEAGASEVLGKPLLVSDLQWQLARVLSFHPCPASP